MMTRMSSRILTRKVYLGTGPVDRKVDASP